MTYNDCFWVTICYIKAPGRRFIQKHDTILFYRFVNENPLRLLVQAVFRRKVFACDKVVDRYVKVLWKQQKHLKIGASFSVFVIWQSLAAYRQIHCDLQLCVALLFSDLPETHHLHYCFYPPICKTKRKINETVFRLTGDIMVTICYNIFVTNCHVCSPLPSSCAGRVQNCPVRKCAPAIFAEYSLYFRAISLWSLPFRWKGGAFQDR